MPHTQIQLPDPLFLCPAEDAPKEEWTLPVVRDLRSFGDPFDDPDWRSNLHLRGVPEPEALDVAEAAPPLHFPCPTPLPD